MGACFMEFPSLAQAEAAASLMPTLFTEAPVVVYFHGDDPFVQFEIHSDDIPLEGRFVDECHDRFGGVWTGS